MEATTPTKFLRSYKHFAKVGGNSQKDVLEMAITRALDDTTLAGANSNWNIWDGATRTIKASPKTAAQLKKDGYELDHVLERQFVSALAIKQIRDDGQQPPLEEFLNDLLSLANMPGNLVYMSGGGDGYHAAKSAFFGKRSDEMSDVVYSYLNACVPAFKADLDRFDTSTEDGTTMKRLIAAIKTTNWYTGGWENVQGLWFDEV